MILVDGSVWIAHLRGRATAETSRLQGYAAERMILLGDLILMEVLQGARDETHAEKLERGMRRFPLAAMLDEEIAVKSARNHRLLRGLGVTVRKTADVVIGTYCIVRGHSLLHADRDFLPMVRHLGLRAA